MNSVAEERTEAKGIIPEAKEIRVRYWRVGSLSMGLNLLFLGVLIMISQWKGVDVFETALAWYPIVFILLGLEIVLYTLWFRGKGKVHYDVLSIFFVGILSICCLVFAGLGSLGLTGEIRSAVSSHEYQYSLPETRSSANGIGKIIVQGDNPYKVKVDQTTGKEWFTFGSYWSGSERLDSELEKNLVRSERTGDTVYLLLGDTPSHALDRSRSGLDVTIAAPAGIKVIVRDSRGNILER
ncbi:hypothetical protein [Paenibacillus durus]|nr:hypothetical protein [Paenibacillus durus]